MRQAQSVTVLMSTKSLKRRNAGRRWWINVQKNELNMHQWTQSPFTELRTLEKQLEIEFDEHQHRETNVEMAEIEMETVQLHLDTHQTFHKDICSQTSSHGRKGAEVCFSLVTAK
jgi:hypothetical protein